MSAPYWTDFHQELSRLEALRREKYDAAADVEVRMQQMSEGAAMYVVRYVADGLVRDERWADLTPAEAQAQYDALKATHTVVYLRQVLDSRTMDGLQILRSALYDEATEIEGKIADTRQRYVNEQMLEEESD